MHLSPLLFATTLAIFYTFIMRGTPVRRIRGIDSRLADAPRARGVREDERIDGISPVAVSDRQFCEFLPLLCQTSLNPGHRLELLRDDSVFDALLRDLATARHLVTWQVFWFKPGRLADRLGDALIERARAGVRVLVLLDTIGSKGLSSGYVERLRRGGVDVREVRPLQWRTLWKFQQRIHLRAIVIDGRVGYTGGFGIDDHWLPGPRQWRDTAVRIEGHAVGQLQGAFVAKWAEATGELLLGDRVFDPGSIASGAGEDCGDSAVAGLLYSSPSFGSTCAERFLVATIAGARRRLWITSAYFVPDRKLRELLGAAARRGVDVRVLTPGGNTDRPATWYAARAHYAELLDAGIRLYEYRPAMLHAKTLVADGTWSMVGTVNVDNRSLKLNDEVALLVWDPAFGAALEHAFERDLERADAVEREALPGGEHAGERFREVAAARFSRLL